MIVTGTFVSDSISLSISECDLAKLIIEKSLEFFSLFTLLLLLSNLFVVFFDFLLTFA